MIKKRLVGLLSHAKKYIVYTILWQWAALLSQVLAVFTIADLLERVVYRAVTVPVIERTIHDPRHWWWRSDLYANGWEQGLLIWRAWM